VHGNISIRNCHFNDIPSIKTKTKKIHNVRTKLIMAEIFFEIKNRYFGKFIFMKILALLTRHDMLPDVDSLKYEKTIIPQNKYVV
jgi:hypothetical protein